MQTPVNEYTLNQQLRSTEMVAILERTRELGGLGVGLILGSETASANGDSPSGITVTITGALTVSVGDSTNNPPQQFALLNGIMADYCPAVTLTDVAASGTRYDYIGIKAALDVTSTFSADFWNPTTKVPYTASANVSNDGFTAQIFEGTATPGQQATYVPAGWVPLAQIEVVNTSIVAVAMLLATVGAQIEAFALTQINGLTGTFTIEGDPSSSQLVTVTPAAGSPNLIKIAVAAAPVLSVQGRTGTVTLSSSTISITPSGSNIELEAPVSSVNGQTGAVSFEVVSTLNGQYNNVTVTSTDNSLSIQTTSGNLNLEVPFASIARAAVPVVASGNSSPQTATISLAIPNVGTMWYVELDTSTQYNGITGGTAVNNITSTGAALSNQVLLTQAGEGYGGGGGGLSRIAGTVGPNVTVAFQNAGSFTGPTPYQTSMLLKATRIA